MIISYSYGKNIGHKDFTVWISEYGPDIRIECNNLDVGVPIHLMVSSDDVSRESYYYGRKLTIKKCKLTSAAKVFLDLELNLNKTIDYDTWIEKSKFDVSRKQLERLKITELELSNCIFNETPDFIHDLSLYTLSIKNSENFTIIPDGFFLNSTNLYRLTIEETQLMEIKQKDFSGLEKLITLQIKSNQPRLRLG